MRVKNDEMLQRMLKAGRLRNYTELARTIGLSPQAISNYRKKARVSPRLVFKFAETYNVSIDWLLTGAGEMHAATSPQDRVCTIALVERVPGKSKPGPALSRDHAVLNTEEIVYVGKLLTILRCTGSVAVPAVKSNIDALYDAVKV